MTVETTKLVSVRVWGTCPACLDKGCPHRKECANHTTAGDFRTEGGASPDLVETDSGWQCSKNPVQTGRGAILSDGSYAHDWLAPVLLHSGLNSNRD